MAGPGTPRSFLTLICVAFLLGTALSSLVEQMTNLQDFKELMEIVSRPRALERRGNGKRYHVATPIINSFSWENCGSSSDPLQIHSLTLQPDPVKLDGNLTISFKSSVASNLVSPIKMELKVKKKVLFWIEIPCVDDVGSCSYDDVCSLVTKMKCPPEFKKYGIPCQCPVKAGSYSLPKAVVSLDIELPGWLSDGDYEVEAHLSTQKHSPIGCVKMYLSVEE